MIMFFCVQLTMLLIQYRALRRAVAAGEAPA